jgi:hypothetical protein
MPANHPATLLLAPLLVFVVLCGHAQPAAAQPTIPIAPTSIKVTLEPVGGQLFARISWTQASAANDVLVMRQPVSGFASLVEQLRDQPAGPHSLRDPEPAMPDDVYYLHEFSRDAEGRVSELGLYGPFQVSPPSTMEFGASGGRFVQYLPFVAAHR